MPFNQTFNGSVYQVINAEGDVILGQNASVSDFLKALADQRKQIEALPNLSDESKQVAVEKIDEARKEGSASKPDTAKLKKSLEDAAEAIKTADTTASSALSLAQTLLKIGTWAATIL